MNRVYIKRPLRHTPWRVMGFERGAQENFWVRLEGERGFVELVAVLEISANVVTLDRCHILGEGRNRLGIRGLADLANMGPGVP